MNEIIEMFIDEEEILGGINAISLVENPAIESDFITLSKEVKLVEVSAEKRILLGAALIPDKAILRVKDGKKFHIFFSKNTVRKGSELFLKNGNQKESTLEHNVKLSGITVVESWIVEDKDKDKSAFYGLSVPVGTWMVSMKVDNEEIYQKAVDGEIKGFSIEGFFADKAIKQSKDDTIIEQIKQIILE
tara:strand:+ start:736 stop:1302 length:567 start_codon:yes stop_codon:yes gene_type:complete